MGQMSRQIFTPLKNQGGFGLIQVMMGLLIVLVIFGAAASHFYQRLMVSQHQRSRENFEIHHMNMKADLENPMVWDETLLANPEMNCLKDNNCTTLEKREFAIHGVSGKALSGPESLGFNTDGSQCTSLEIGCPVRWHFEWRPLCSDLATCPFDAEVEISGELAESALMQSRLNLERFRIVIYKKLF